MATSLPYTDKWLKVKTIKRVGKKDGKTQVEESQSYHADHSLLVEIDTKSETLYDWQHLLDLLREQMSEFQQNWLILLDAHHAPTLNNNFIGSEELLPYPNPPPPPEAIVKLIFSDPFMLDNEVEPIENIIAEFLGVTATFLEMYDIYMNVQPEEDGIRSSRVEKKKK